MAERLVSLRLGGLAGQYRVYGIGYAVISDGLRRLTHKMPLLGEVEPDA